jgi:hypothetical protein
MAGSPRKRAKAEPLALAPVVANGLPLRGFGPTFLDHQSEPSAATRLPSPRVSS